MMYFESVYLRLSELTKLAGDKDRAAIEKSIFDPEDGVPKDLFYDYLSGDLNLELMRDGRLFADNDICYADISPELTTIIFDFAKESQNDVCRLKTVR